jgi:hypothetical protein
MPGARRIISNPEDSFLLSVPEVPGEGNFFLAEWNVDGAPSEALPVDTRGSTFPASKCTAAALVSKHDRLVLALGFDDGYLGEYTIDFGSGAPRMAARLPLEQLLAGPSRLASRVYDIVPVHPREPRFLASVASQQKGVWGSRWEALGWDLPHVVPAMTADGSGAARRLGALPGVWSEQPNESPWLRVATCGVAGISWFSVSGAVPGVRLLTAPTAPPAAADGEEGDPVFAGCNAIDVWAEQRSSPRIRGVVAIGDDGAVRVWSLRGDNPEQVLSVELPNATPTLALFGPDGNTIFTAWSDGFVRWFSPEAEPLPRDRSERRQAVRGRLFGEGAPERVMAGAAVPSASAAPDEGERR